MTRRPTYENLKQRIKFLEEELIKSKQVEEYLQATKNQFRQYFNLPLIGIAIITPDKRWIEVNDKLCEILGYSREELYKRTWADLTPKEDLKKEVVLYNRVLQGDSDSETLEKTYIRKDGTLVNTKVSAICVRKPDGSVDYFLWLIEDITERKRAEEALRESETRLRTLSDNLYGGIVFQVDFGEDGRERRFTYISAGVEKLCGITVNEALNDARLLYGLIMEEDRHLLAEREALALANTSIFSAEVRFRIPSGEIRWGLFTSVPRRLPNYHLVWDGIAIDVTERRRLQERLSRAEKMEALGLMAGGVAHDLNNVLGIVTGYSELLLLGTEESSPLRPYATNIMNATERAGAIIQDMLTLARRGVQNRKVINLNTLIRNFMKTPEFERIKAFHPGVQVETRLEQTPLHIMGSPLHIEKTIINLVLNAAEAMPNGGLLTISTRNQYMDRPVLGYDNIREGDYVLLSVSDSGEGISENDIRHIFEPFYTKKVMGRSGTGLGLSVVWGTVKDHNSYIDVQSKEGKGSTFSLYFPVTREELAEEPISISMADYMGKGESILVVDDIEGQRELAARMFEKLNYRVNVVSSGEEAFEYMKDHRADLIVLDMIMDPGMDGLDTYRKILEIHPNQKAIIVSGYSETDRVTQAQVLGAGTYVKKPYVLEKLGLAVKSELDRSI